MSQFASKYKYITTLAYTHYQAAHWTQDPLLDLSNLTRALEGLEFCAGTQASFMEIFHGNGDESDRLNEMFCKRAGFPSTLPVSTQTCTRKVDLIVAPVLAGLGATAQRICIDIRHMTNLKEIKEYVFPLLSLINFGILYMNKFGTDKF